MGGFSTLFSNIYSISSTKKWTIGNCAATLQGGESWNLGLDRRLLQTQVDEEVMG